MAIFLLATLVAGAGVPSTLLDQGDQAVLVAPVVDFSNELARLSLEPPKFHAVTNSGNFDGLAVGTELQDLADALKKAGVSTAEAGTVCAAHRAELEKLNTWLEMPEPRPAFPLLLPAIGLPDEFADYFDGAVAWADPAQTNKDLARLALREVLSLPAPQRHFKATWAAFMLGKSWPRADPARAVVYFKRVQDLAARGFSDPLGLAAESLGLEAEAELQQGHAAEAIQLYHQQFATGVPSARESLYLTVAALVNNNNAESLAALAADPKVRPVITATLTSGHATEPAGVLGPAAARKWLAAVPAARITNLESAEIIALLAYQAGEWATAQTWIDRAQPAPVAQWLQAKLWLRAGKVEQAAGLMAKVTALFPLDPPAQTSRQWEDDLTVPGETYLSARINAPRQVLGELGVLRMARREYVEALDAFIRSGFWLDAAYVGERVLTVDELKNYVDRNWPAPVVSSTTNRGADFSPADPGGVPPPATTSQTNLEFAPEPYPKDLSGQIRHLLARRLARLERPSEARPYYPPECQIQADVLAQALASGADLSKSDEARAHSLFTAAQMTETNGLDLLATETEPDWRLKSGDPRLGDALSGTTNTSTNLLQPSLDELSHAGTNTNDPDAAFHWRFQAASIAWQAALLMPDNSDDTARVLCQAGSWIKYLDPKKADLFYKALVRRCRRTRIGTQADAMRWFPVLDDHGNPVPYEPPPAK